MSKKNQIIRAVGQEADISGETVFEAEHEIEPAEYESDAEAFDEYADEDDHAPHRFRWFFPALAILTVVGWTALYGWAIRGELMAAASSSPAQWTRWIIDWSVPVLLVAVTWLIAMRNSRAEAQRFASTASMLSEESARLEERLNVVNRELSLAREFLGAQSLELESLGRVASEKISSHASELQDLIKANGKQVDRIGSASETALSNMTRLRDDLPVVANSARDVSNQVGNAGRTAQEQLEKLVSGFERLNQFGSASEKQVTVLGKKVGETLIGFEAQLSQIEGLVANRFTALQTEAGVYRDEINEAEQAALSTLSERITLLQSDTKAVSARLAEAETSAIEKLQRSKTRVEAEISEMAAQLDSLDEKALEAAKKRIGEFETEAGRLDELLSSRDARFVEEMERKQAAFETREAQATEVLAQRLADLDEAIAERRETQSAETEKLVAHSQNMTEQLDELSALIGKISDQGDATRESLTTGLDDLDNRLEAKRATLVETEAQLEKLTEASVRLLEIIQSGAKHSREDLPAAIKTAADDLGAVETRASELSALMFETNKQGNDLSSYLVQTREDVAAADASIEELQGKLAAQTEDTLAKLQGLRSGLASLTNDSKTLAEETQETLRGALEQLEVSTKAAFTALDDGAREKVTALADGIGQEAIEALERSLRTSSAETIGKLEQAAAHASGVGREATVQLRDQLVKVNELTGNLEQRISDAREHAEEQVNNDFARRMSLITDSLNSNAIDIASALSEEVSDTAWDAYLKGDRGIFTRRAVRLIEGGEAREIADLYQRDEAFKGNVSRFIHDFEKMLRSMLSTRDGNALGVTVLGSDMGKLYVVLAQSIERFRN
ncbi:ATPase [Erythrobacter sp. F6033]|uniref:ATPase n=1 Tax=Erythrobacter sp. F6033 TaxID=2926401 RepID=UPI001FF153CC|nr:ATPase [Erythrobacter sp. F6033]MCK0128297.1 ATPase [Erythrobacter sp. F6033]